MITNTYRASDLFVVRQKQPLHGNPIWADLTIESNRSLPKNMAHGAGLYAIHFHGALIYVGKFCGKKSDPFAGRICDIRWARHIATLTLRDRRISLSEGRCKQLRRSSAAPLIDIVMAMQAQTIHQNRGRATSINRVLFAAEHWAEFLRIEEASGLEGFSITYTQIVQTDGVDPICIRGIVSRAEAMAIDRLQPRCNGEVRVGGSMNADIPEAAAILAASLEDAIAAASGCNALTSPIQPEFESETPDERARGGRAQNEGSVEDPEDPGDPAEVTAEELFWERIDGEPLALSAMNTLIEALSNIADADFHFTKTSNADLRVHRLSGPRVRLNVACFAWQSRLRRFIIEIGLPVDSCLALGATSARPNHQGKRLSTIATFNLDGPNQAICNCALAALEYNHL